MKMQYNLIKQEKDFGGDKAKGKRKERRPVAVKKPMHLIMKSNENSLLKNAKRIRPIIKTFSVLFGVRILELSINSNHIHFCIQGKTRKGIQDFNRAIAGTIALKLTSARKGVSLTKSFWKQTIYSRIVEWGRDLTNLCKYIVMNQKEALGIISYTSRGREPKKKNRPSCSRVLISHPK